MSTSKRRGRRPKRTMPPEPGATRLQRWLDENNFTSAQLEAATGLSRQAMTKIRAAVGDVRRTTMRRILDGACILAGRRVRMEEIFDLDPQKWTE